MGGNLLSSYSRDTDDTYTDCKKNPGHVGFIPLENCLEMDDRFLTILPFEYRNNKKLLRDLIEQQAKLSVMVVTEYSVGTGFIVNINKPGLEDAALESICKENQCKNLPKHVSREIIVRTSSHVLKKYSRVSKVSCRMFENRNSDIEIIEGDITSAVYKKELAYFVCRTCNSKLLELLQDSLDRFDELATKVEEKFESRRETNSYAVLVSHPHGTFQHVSIGPFYGKNSLVKSMSCIEEIIYGAATCSGCSGAYVFKLGGYVETRETVHVSTLKTNSHYIARGNAYRDYNQFPSDSHYYNYYSFFYKFIIDKLIEAWTFWQSS